MESLNMAHCTKVFFVHKFHLKREGENIKDDGKRWNSLVSISKLPVASSVLCLCLLSFFFLQINMKSDSKTRFTCTWKQMHQGKRSKTTTTKQETPVSWFRTSSSRFYCPCCFVFAFPSIPFFPFFFLFSFFLSLLCLTQTWLVSDSSTTVLALSPRLTTSLSPSTSISTIAK